MATDLAPLILQALQVVAASASTVAAYLSFKVARENKRLSEQTLSIARANRVYTRNSTNRSAAAKHEEMIAQYPELLQLHGVEPDQLAQIGIGKTEAAYLISSFTAGDLFYTDGEVTELTEYRKRLLESPKVRVFWSAVLDNRLIGPSPFSEMVNAHIARRYEPSGAP